MRKKLPVGIQVYGLRDLLENTPEQFPAVMKQVKELGYDGVELAGLYGLDPTFIRDTLAEIGLTPLSAHVPLADMTADIEKVIADYQLIGVDYLVVPYLPEEYRHLTPGYPVVIEEMKKIGAPSCSAASPSACITSIWGNSSTPPRWAWCWRALC